MRVNSGHIASVVALFGVAACTKIAIGHSTSDAVFSGADGASLSAIHHLVVLVQENHSFDNYFGTYCRARPGSNPACTQGPDCCEAGPASLGGGLSPTVLDDAEHAAYSPPHDRQCEVWEINGGRMDRFTLAPCGSPRHFAYADPELVAPYRDWADQYALADRYFQSVAGASSSNDMYLARASYVFTDNEYEPHSIADGCGDEDAPRKTFLGKTVGDLLSSAGISWAFYAEGYDDMARARKAGACPAAPSGCAAGLQDYPCIFDAGDVPFEYFDSTRDQAEHIQDLRAFLEALDEGVLPSVSFVKLIGYKTEHPGLGVRLSDGVRAVKELVDRVLASSALGDDTLIVLTYDEGGGYYDHVAPPAPNRVDGQPYGPRIPTLALGPFARRGSVSHVQMEHASLVKFIEWNWLGGRTGQLGTRDVTANNIGSLLDPLKTVVPVPEK